MKAINMNNDVKFNEIYWDKFYKQVVVRVPSQFCVMVATEADNETCMVEFGCGNGRDSLYFGKIGFNVCSMDLSREAVASCRLSAGAAGLQNISFEAGSIADETDVVSLISAARQKTKSGKITGYSRFVMHSIGDEQESNFLNHISNNMQSTETIFLEYRSREDANLEKIFGGHYRRFVDTQELIKKATSHFGFKLNYRITGQGMARYKHEDPFVSRLILEKL